MRELRFPVMFLVLLVAFMAILTRVVTPLARDVWNNGGIDLSASGSVAASFILVSLGFILGTIVVVARRRTFLSLIVGASLGLLLGIVFIPVVVVPVPLASLGSIVWVLVALALLMLGTAMIDSLTQPGQHDPTDVPAIEEEPPH